MRTTATASVPVEIPVENAVLQGDLTVPDQSLGLVVFAHGSGSSRRSTRNRAVAGALQQNRLATLLMDLLTAPEEAIDNRTGGFRFDIDLLAKRVASSVDWMSRHPSTTALPIGLFGASTGAAAALIAAAQKPDLVRAVVSRGGRPDLAREALPAVQAPTLLIVGGSDEVVITLNERAYAQLRCERQLEIVPHATHLFEEPGTLEEVARLAAAWFRRYLPVESRTQAPAGARSEA